MTASRFSGERLRAARVAAGVRPEVLAVVIGRSVHTIDAYELRQVVPPLDVALALADALAVSIYDLLTEQTGAEKVAVSRVRADRVLSRLATLMALPGAQVNADTLAALREDLAAES